ncbi:MAG: hypothetical protein KJ011_06455 [Burkholderiaceae bacterium]|nr:hypothetical protein [Burkholderiaceae bacterium]
MSEESREVGAGEAAQAGTSEPSNEQRRGFLTSIGIGAGAAVAGATGTALTAGGVLGALGPTEAHAARSKLVKLDDVFKQFGKYILVVPGKFTGTVAAIDMYSGKTLAWTAFWNYGDDNPIIHHMAAFPSPDPYKEFEFIVNSQGGKNLYIYGIPTTVKNPGQGFKIYRMKYDGNKLNLVSEIASKTGLGLGVHVTVSPDAKRFSVGDGQKDIFAEFDRASEKVNTAWLIDWTPNNKELARAWVDGGKITIKRLKPTLPGDKYDYEGTKGCKIDWEMVPGGELFVEQGKVTGERPTSVVGIDAFVYDPRGKWGVVSLRTPGVSVVFDVEKWVPVAALPGPKGEPSQVPMKKIDDDTWEITMDKVVSPAHQAGFSPDGKHFLFMNGVRQNNIMVWDSSNHADPSKWTKKAVVESPDWRGAYPNTFHMVFTPDAKKVYVTLWWPSPTPNGIAVVDAVNWKLLKSVDLGPDMHTMGITYDGKYVVGVMSGFQKTVSSIVVMETATDEVVGFFPSTGGHHDNVIVPRTLEDLRVSRSTTT